MKITLLCFSQEMKKEKQLTECTDKAFLNEAQPNRLPPRSHTMKTQQQHKFKVSQEITVHAD